MKLPLLLSVPHAGLRVPSEAEPYCILTPQQIVEDGDEGAADIYALEPEVAAYLTTDVARAIVDLNRADDDRGADGVVKTHTCWSIPVYREFPPEEVVETLLARHYRPYHARLRDLAGRDVRLGLDCHTMLAKGPPVGPDPGGERPWVCFSSADGTCPEEWIASLRAGFEKFFAGPVWVNKPFKGGYITRSHAAELPWVQLEISRGDFMRNAEKRELVVAALRYWCEELS